MYWPKNISFGTTFSEPSNPPCKRKTILLFYTQKIFLRRKNNSSQTVSMNSNIPIGPLHPPLTFVFPTLIHTSFFSLYDWQLITECVTLRLVRFNVVTSPSRKQPWVLSLQSEIHHETIWYRRKVNFAN